MTDRASEFLVYVLPSSVVCYPQEWTDPTPISLLITWLSYRGLRFIDRRLFDHAGHANFRVESPLARGSPDAATSTRWDLGRHITQVLPGEWLHISRLPKSVYSNCKLTLKYLHFPYLIILQHINRL
ncbi:hypothetical protein V1477_014910, partial [Vespula maculifrons]